MKARQAASIALAAALLLGTSGCTLFAIQGTRYHYQPSDGVPANVGSLQLRNILGVSEDGKDVTVLFTVINSSAESEDLTLQFVNAEGDKVDVTFTIEGNESRSFKGEDVVLRDVDTTVGGRFDLFVTVPGKQGEQVLVPVLDGTLPEYGINLPMPLPSPTPSATSTPTAPGNAGDAETEGEDSGE